MYIIDHQLSYQYVRDRKYDNFISRNIITYQIQIRNINIKSTVFFYDNENRELAIQAKSANKVNSQIDLESISGKVKLKILADNSFCLFFDSGILQFITVNTVLGLEVSIRTRDAVSADGRANHLLLTRLL